MGYTKARMVIREGFACGEFLVLFVLKFILLNLISKQLNHNLLSSLLLLSVLIVLNWIFSSVGTHVHTATFAAPMPNGNTNAMGIVLRNFEGSLVKCIASTVPSLSFLRNLLLSIVVALRCAFIE